MAGISLELAYPGIEFQPRTRNWWARLTRVPPECVHLETAHAWMATFLPDTLFLRGRAHAQRRPARPEVSLCRACLVGALQPELAACAGRVVAFEPDPALFTQYFFLGAPDFDAAGLVPEVSAAIQRRLEEGRGTCETCSRTATWLWLARDAVASLDDFARIGVAPGRRFCAAHGARALCCSFEAIAEANLFYVNVPYGEAGAYVWI